MGLHIRVCESLGTGLWMRGSVYELCRRVFMYYNGAWQKTGVIGARGVFPSLCPANQRFRIKQMLHNSISKKLYKQTCARVELPHTSRVKGESRHEQQLVKVSLELYIPEKVYFFQLDE